MQDRIFMWNRLSQCKRFNGSVFLQDRLTDKAFVPVPAVLIAVFLGQTSWRLLPPTTILKFPPRPKCSFCDEPQSSSKDCCNQGCLGALEENPNLKTRVSEIQAALAASTFDKKNEVRYEVLKTMLSHYTWHFSSCTKTSCFQILGPGPVHHCSGQNFVNYQQKLEEIGGPSSSGLCESSDRWPCFGCARSVWPTACRRHDLELGY